MEINDNFLPKGFLIPNSIMLVSHTVNFKNGFSETDFQKKPTELWFK